LRSKPCAGGLAQFLELIGHGGILAELGGDGRFGMVVMFADPQLIGAVCYQCAAFVIDNHLRVQGGLKGFTQNGLDTA
jgi:hypothetical protein